MMSLLMMATKHNITIESTVPVIGREKQMRPENFCRDVSLIGVALILLGGMGGDALTDVYDDGK